MTFVLFLAIIYGMAEEKKKEYGQFFTNRIIADFMSHLLEPISKDQVLDPSLGMGSLLDGMNALSKNLHLTGCEIDPQMAERFQNQHTYSLNLLQGDYLQIPFERQFDRIICNPPYHRFQEIKNRSTLMSEFQSRYGVKMSGYSNSCVYFLIKSMQELKEKGRCCYIMPYEFLNTGYGVCVKEALLKSRMLKMILKFDHKIQVFEDAVTTACIVLLEHIPNERVSFGTIHSLAEIENGTLADSVELLDYGYEELIPNQKWSKFFEKDLGTHQHATVSLDSLVKIRRGIATGANEYFLLSKSRLEELGIRRECCRLCIPKAKLLKSNFLSQKEMEDLIRQDKNVFLFDAKRAELECEKAYIRQGEEMGIMNRYLTSHRTPWYAIENRKPAPVLLCVFNRDNIKVVRNEAMIYSLTTFHSLYPLEETNIDMDVLFCYLLTPTAQRLLKENKREYARGLEKFEPSDLMKAKCVDIRKLSEHDVEKIHELYKKMKKKFSDEQIQKLDEIFKGYI